MELQTFPTKEWTFFQAGAGFLQATSIPRRPDPDLQLACQVPVGWFGRGPCGLVAPSSPRSSLGTVDCRSQILTIEATPDPPYGPLNNNTG